MHHQPPRSGPPRDSFRPSLVMVERRRRELEGPGTQWWPSGNAYRAAAACVLTGMFVAAAVGVGMSADTDMISAADAEYADGLPHIAPSGRESRVSRVVPIQTRSAHHAALRARSSRKSARRRHDPMPAVTAAPTVTGAPAETAAPAPPTMLSAAPWTLTADGTWTTIASLAVPAGTDPKKLNITFSSDTADVLPLDPNATLAPGAIVTTGWASHAVTIVANSTDPAVGSQSLVIPAPPLDPTAFAAVAQAVGPHLIDVGWMPLDPSSNVLDYKIYRRAAGARHGSLVASVSPTGRMWHDDSVAPSTSYKYTVVASRDGGSLVASTRFVSTPGAMTSSTIDAISGKGMFLYFTPGMADENGYGKYDPNGIVAKAVSSGISHIEVRMARGTFFEGSNAAARAWLDTLIDKAAASGIKLIAWQVPRRASSADAAAAVAAARYETAAGNGFAGLSLDIEDGDNYMGLGETAKQRMVDYIQTVRQAVGPDFLLVATVMSPALTHWTNARYPFARIAPFASVMQPMEYWHHFYSSSHHAYTQDEVTSACADSVSLTRQAAGRDIPINVAGQSDDLGTTGPPSPDEIGWCLAASKNAGAIGQTFFDWRGTNDDNWTAIAGFAW